METEVEHEEILSVKPIKRVVLYFKDEGDNWGKNVEVLVDVQLRFPYGSLTVFRGFKISVTPKTRVAALLLPTFSIHGTNLPLLGGKDLLSSIEKAVMGTYNKICPEAKPGDIWEQSKTGDELYCGTALREYNNAQYRKN